MTDTLRDRIAAAKEAADRLVKEFDGIAPAVAKQEGI